MNQLRKVIFCIILLSSFSFSQQREIVAYYGGFHSPRHGMLIKDITQRNLADKLTTIIYAFARTGQDSLLEIVPEINTYFAYQEVYSSNMSVDGIADDSTQALRGNFNQLRKLKNKYPHLKILLSIGGWGGSKYFSDAALTPGSREKFVNTCIDYFIKGNLPVAGNAGGPNSAKGIFDGFDIDWEFPISDGAEGTHYNVNDRENQSALFALFRKKMNEINPNLILTAAVSARVWEFWKYNFKEDQKYLDWYNVMTYDFHGIWDTITGHHTNLLSSPKDPDSLKESLDHAVKYLLNSAFVSSSKIVPGAAFYAKHWAEVDSIDNGLYQPAKNDTAGNYLQIENYMDYSNIIKDGYKIYWDDFALAPWLYSPAEKKFWTFDDPRSIALKARYVDAYNLRGLMFWALAGDDSMGTLVNTIYNKNMPDINTAIAGEKNDLLKIKIIEPAKSEKFTQGSDIIIKTKSSDTKRKIIKVEFFVDNKSIGYNRFSPFDWAWFNASQGEHLITTKATDEHGGTNSSSIKIKVNSR